MSVDFSSISMQEKLFPSSSNISTLTILSDGTKILKDIFLAAIEKAYKFPSHPVYGQPKPVYNLITQQMELKPQFSHYKVYPIHIRIFTIHLADSNLNKLLAERKIVTIEPISENFCIVRVHPSCIAKEDFDRIVGKNKAINFDVLSLKGDFDVLSLKGDIELLNDENYEFLHQVFLANDKTGQIISNLPSSREVPPVYVDRNLGFYVILGEIFCLAGLFITAAVFAVTSLPENCQDFRSSGFSYWTEVDAACVERKTRNAIIGLSLGTICLVYLFAVCFFHNTNKCRRTKEALDLL